MLDFKKMKMNHSWSKISTAILLALGGAGLASLGHASTNASASHIPVATKKRKSRKSSVKLVSNHKTRRIGAHIRRFKRNRASRRNLKRNHMKAIKRYNQAPRKQNQVKPKQIKRARRNKRVRRNRFNYTQHTNHKAIKRVTTRSAKPQRNTRVTKQHRNDSSLNYMNNKLNQVSASIDQNDDLEPETETQPTINPNGFGTGQLTYGRKYERKASRLKGVPFSVLKQEVKSKTPASIWKNYYAGLNKNDLAAKLLISSGESMGDYNATNGEAFGRFQLKRFNYRGHHSLHYIYTHKQYQEDSATRYMQQRYKTWHGAGNHWISYNWW